MAHCHQQNVKRPVSTRERKSLYATGAGNVRSSPERRGWAIRAHPLVTLGTRDGLVRVHDILREHPIRHRTWNRSHRNNRVALKVDVERARGRQRGVERARHACLRRRGWRWGGGRLAPVRLELEWSKGTHRRRLLEREAGHGEGKIYTAAQ